VSAIACTSAVLLAESCARICSHKSVYETMSRTRNSRMTVALRRELHSVQNRTDSAQTRSASYQSYMRPWKRARGSVAYKPLAVVSWRGTQATTRLSSAVGSRCQLKCGCNYRQVLSLYCKSLRLLQHRHQDMHSAWKLMQVFCYQPHGTFWNCN
jgi:hypothetical protein